MTLIKTTNEPEVPLLGGNSNAGIVRVGNTVRRTMTAKRQSVHRLLSFLQDSGFNACPEFLGIDEQGREVLSYLAGDCGIYPQFWEDDSYLISAAKLLREYHEVAKGFVLNEDDTWDYEYPDKSRHEVICHNDFAPYNLIFNGGQFDAIIDFDLAGPGPKLRDVAYAAYWLVPLSLHAEDMKVFTLADVKNNSQRLHQFCETYGVQANSDLLDMVSEVLHYMSDEAVLINAIGEEAAARLKAEGHLEHWANETLYFDKDRALIQTIFCQSLEVLDRAADCSIFSATINH